MSKLEAKEPLELGQLVQRNIRTIAQLEEKAWQSRSTTDRIADAVTRWTGSMTTVILHVLWFGGWVVVNSGMIPFLPPFDPFPFELLTTVVSLEAIFLTIFVLISQNRASRQADRRAHLDLQINLLAEQESTKALQMLEAICEHLGLEYTRDEETRELEESSHPEVLERALEKHIPSA
ncbi:MAG: DUF1003 domain-containing protein [Pseudomonadota bacterium]|uniref:DUF1003 domain-containing protein n=1 Tax=Thermithiobacillus tepidarius TaxID=929 RepID=UPI000424A670|nr:DUF1003 domain-containing protein [Thermithiobacillus tepidarius]